MVRKKKIDEEEKPVVSKSLKNIIGGIVVFVLCIAMIVTGHFAFKDMKNKDANISNNRPSLNMNRPDDSVKKKEKTTDEDTTNDKIDPNEEDKTSDSTKKKTKKDSNKQELKEDNFRNNKPEKSGMKLIYVLLFVIEAFLLGAVIMFLVYTNII